MARTNFDQLLQAGCHFGHLKRKWNPAMAPYIYTERNGIHIIDLHKTAEMIDTAADALKQIAKSGKNHRREGSERWYALRYRALAGWYVDQLPDYPQGREENGEHRQAHAGWYLR